MKYNTRNSRTYSRFLKGPITGMVFFIVVVVVSLTYTQTTYAGLFSFVSNLVGTGQVSAGTQTSGADSSTTNSQKMTLLQAASNPNPNPNNCSDVSPINGTILDANISASVIASCGSTNTTISTYTVSQGDTIGTVAEMFDVSVNTILWANNLTGKSILKTGQTLVILPISGINYTVKNGDTFESISKKYGGVHAADILTDILNYNDLTMKSTLVIGQNIIIPGVDLSSSAQSMPVSPISSPRCISTYERLLDNISKLPNHAGYFVRPIVGGYKSQCLHGHNAVDFAAPVGTSIRASASGTVIVYIMNNGWNGGYGNYVVIKHDNGSQTLYAHMSINSKDMTYVGQRVEQGQAIGYVGLTGLTTGAHVHFEIRGAQNTF